MGDEPSAQQSDYLASRLGRAAMRLGRVTASVHKGEHGLTSPEFQVLMILGGPKEEGGHTSSSIVRITAMDKTKVSRAVSALDRRGWLERRRASDDRRFEHLALTEIGWTVYNELIPKVLDAEGTILDRMSHDERDGLEIGLSGLDKAFHR